MRPIKENDGDVVLVTAGVIIICSITWECWQSITWECWQSCGSLANAISNTDGARSYSSAFLPSVRPSVRPCFLPSVRASVRQSVLPSVSACVRPCFLPSRRAYMRTSLLPRIRSMRMAAPALLFMRPTAARTIHATMRSFQISVSASPLCLMRPTIVLMFVRPCSRSIQQCARSTRSFILPIIP